MDCPECGGDAQLLIGGGHFTHVTGYVCDDCGIVLDTVGRRHSERVASEKHDATSILTRVGGLFHKGSGKTGR